MNKPVSTVTSIGLHICIVDDRPEIRHLIKLILLGNGREFSQTGTVAQAREFVSELKPQVVLLDAMLPDGECGYAFCSEIKRKPDAPLVIMMSARRDEASVNRARDAMADGFIAKPFSPGFLRSIIEAIEETPGSPDKCILDFWPES